MLSTSMFQYFEETLLFYYFKVVHLEQALSEYKILYNFHYESVTSARKWCSKHGYHLWRIGSYDEWSFINMAIDGGLYRVNVVHTDLQCDTQVNKPPSLLLRCDFSKLTKFNNSIMLFI